MVFAAIIGTANGILVVRTKLPSFIITLATFFVLRGVDVGVTLLLTNTVRFDISDGAPGFESARAILGSTFLAPYNFQDAVLWWIAITAIATWVLTQTTFGNWIFAGWDSNWYFTFLGVILFVAVGVNTLVRRRAASARR